MSDATQPTPTPVEQLSYEQARDELVATVRQLEGGQAPLQQSLQLWERGEALARHCQGFLDEARKRVAVASPQAVGGDQAQTGTGGVTGNGGESAPAGATKQADAAGPQAQTGTGPDAPAPN